LNRERLTKSPPTKLERLGARLHEQVLEVASLRLALDIQARRIAGAQAEPDVPPQSQQASSVTA
jgi:hypothetical protein